MDVMRHAAGLPSEGSTAGKGADRLTDFDLTPVNDSKGLPLCPAADMHCSR